MEALNTNLFVLVAKSACFISYNMKTTALSRELAAKPVTCEQLDTSDDVGSVIEDRVTAASLCL